MGRQGILLNDEKDLQIGIKRDASGLIMGGMVVGESDCDHVALIVESDKGDFKDFPVLGVGEKYLKSVGRVSQLRAEIQTQLELDGYKADVQVDDTGKLVIDVD